MKGLSYRIWILALGIVVALVIIISTFLHNANLVSSFSVTPRPQTRPGYSTAISTFVKKVGEVFTAKNP